MIFFQIRNILVGAHKYSYSLNNNYAIYGKNSVFTIFIETLNSNGYLSLFFLFSKHFYKQFIVNRIFFNYTYKNDIELIYIIKLETLIIIHSNFWPF
jgi:hypothetical protein